MWENFQDCQMMGAASGFVVVAAGMVLRGGLRGGGCVVDVWWTCGGMCIARAPRFHVIDQGEREREST
jgi:hypothetical protein